MNVKTVKANLDRMCDGIMNVTTSFANEIMEFLIIQLNNGVFAKKRHSPFHTENVVMITENNIIPYMYHHTKNPTTQYVMR